jgi:hypothetical protein
MNCFWLNYPKDGSYFDDIIKMKKLKDIKGDSSPLSPLCKRRGRLFKCPKFKMKKKMNY